MSGLRLDAAALFAPFAHHRRIGLAVSGGADSLALMLLAADVARAAGAPGRFVVYSVDHALRPEAAQEVRDVLALAERLGLPARGLRWAGDKPSSGLQAAARQARYRLIGAAMAADGCSALATAHHRNDQAETVLMRLAHGSGLEGLAGMAREAEVEGITVLRPLLEVDPALLAALVDARGLVPARDPGNWDRDYERVRWRQMLPQLADLGLDAGRLAILARRAGEADDALAAMAAAAAREIDAAGERQTVAFERAWLGRLPRPVAVRLLQKLLGDVSGRRMRSLGAVERLAARLAEGPVRTTLHGCLVSAGPRLVRISPEPPRKAPTRPSEGTGKAVTTY